MAETSALDGSTDDEIGDGATEAGVRASKELVAVEFCVSFCEDSLLVFWLWRPFEENWPRSPVPLPRGFLRCGVCPGPGPGPNACDRTGVTDSTDAIDGIVGVVDW